LTSIWWVPLGIIAKNNVMHFGKQNACIIFQNAPWDFMFCKHTSNTLKNLEGFHISITMLLHPLEASYDVIVEEPQPNCCWFNLGNLFVKGKVL
jgi:hypothetical protein